MEYNIKLYDNLRIAIETLRENVDDSKIEYILSGLKKLNAQVLTNPITNHPNNMQRDIDLVDIVFNYYKDLYNDNPDNLGRRALGKEKRLYVGMLDIDDFRRFNKQFGESVGNFTLAKSADIVRNTLRKDDEVLRLSPESSSYHLHGEEKLIIFKSKSQEDAINVADKVRKAIERESKDEIGYSITESIGLTTWDSDNEGYLIAQERADYNMQIAKKQGRNRVYFSDDAHISSSDILNNITNKTDSLINENEQEEEHIKDCYRMSRRLGCENQLYVAMSQRKDLSYLKRNYSKDAVKLLIEKTYEIAAKTLRESDLSCICDENRMTIYKCRTDADALRLAKKVVEAVEKESFDETGYKITECFGVARWHPKVEGLSKAQECAINNMITD